MGAALAANRDEPIQEMNTTPLIDVMLVLLIMFIITIPIQTHKVDLDLPSSEPLVRVDLQRNKIAIEPNGAILWNGAPIELPELRGALARIAAIDPPPELHVEPHSEARYEVVDEVLATIRRAQVRSMGFVGNERYASF